MAVNINRDVKDVFFRYKMPRLIAKVRGAVARPRCSPQAKGQALTACGARAVHGRT